jgi:GNAT superfamily N-acetyltransferase
MSNAFGPRKPLFGPYTYRAKQNSNGDTLIAVYVGPKRIAHMDAYWAYSMRSIEGREEEVKQRGRGRSCATDLRALGAEGRYPNVLAVSHAFVTDDEHKGKGVGRAMYEAMMAEGFAVRESRIGGQPGPMFFIPDECSGAGNTSAEARRVWDSLVRDYPSQGTSIRVDAPPVIGSRKKTNPRRRNPSSKPVEERVQAFFDDFDAQTVPCPFDKQARMFPDVPVSIILEDGEVYATIAFLQAHPSIRASGAGTEAMRRILDLADKHGVRLFLDPVPLDKGWSWERLVRWYASFGFMFEEPDEEEREASGLYSMLREPGAKGARRPNPRRRKNGAYNPLAGGSRGKSAVVQDSQTVVSADGLRRATGRNRKVSTSDWMTGRGHFDIVRSWVLKERGADGKLRVVAPDASLEYAEKFLGMTIPAHLRLNPSQHPNPRQNPKGLHWTTCEEASEFACGGDMDDVVAVAERADGAYYIVPHGNGYALLHGFDALKVGDEDVRVYTPAGWAQETQRLYRGNTLLTSKAEAEVYPTLAAAKRKATSVAAPVPFSEPPRRATYLPQQTFSFVPGHFGGGHYVKTNPNPRRRNPSVFDTLTPGDLPSIREQLRKLSPENQGRLQDELNAMDDALAASLAGRMRLYHGTQRDIAEGIRARGFARTKGKRSGFMGATYEVENQGIFLTENRALAEAFGRNRSDYGKGTEVLEVFADVRSPLDMTVWSKVPKPLRVLGERLVSARYGQKKPKQEDMFWLIDQPEFMDAVRASGYDAVRFYEGAATVKSLGLGRKGEVTLVVLDPSRLQVAPPARGSFGSLLWHLERKAKTNPRRRNPLRSLR